MNRKFFVIILLTVILHSTSFATEANVKLGIDVLLEEKPELLANKRVALLTNFTGRVSDGRLTAEVF